MAVKESLTKIVGAKNVFDDPEILEQYSKDESFTRPAKPQYVVKPKNKDEVQKIIKWANETGMPLVPVSSGRPHFRGDTIPRFGGVVIDLSNMNSIVRIDRSNRVAMVEPGVRFGELQEALKKEGLRLPMPLCPRNTKSVMGAALEREPHIIPKYHLDMSDPLLCNEVIFGTGDLFYTGEAAGPGTIAEQWAVRRSQKDPMGPAMVNYHRLLQGAQGTLGIATWSTVKCEILPRVQKPFLVTSDRFENLIDFVYKILRLRLGDECFILNNLNLASLLKKDSASIEALREVLPSRVLFFTVAGYENMPEERAAYQEHDVMKWARNFGLTPTANISGISSWEVLRAISQPSEEPYWKLRPGGGCRDIFFITTMDKTPQFINTMYEIADQKGFPSSNIGVYIQPLNQGHNCHCEFNLTYNSTDEGERIRVEDLFLSASNTFINMGGFFSRPYGPWADMAFNRDAMTRDALLKVKKIFDPNGILNPGKLCF